MADTAYGVNSPETNKLWAKRLYREALRKTYIKRFMGEESSNLIQVKTESNKAAGDRVRVTLRMQLTEAGVIGDANLEGAEESLTTFTDDLIINQLRHAVRSEGKMTEQRIPWKIREETMIGLSDWWADRWDTWAFNQLAGYTVQTDPRFTGLNPISPATRQVFRGAHTTDEDIPVAPPIVADETFSLELIDKAVEEAKVGTPPIRPIIVNGDRWFVAFLHPYQVTDLRTNATLGQVTWYDIQKAAMTGGVTGETTNPIFSGALGTYNGVILHESTRVPEGVDSTTGATIPSVRRAIMCGAQAGIAGFGIGHDQETYDWFEQLFDYGNKLGVKAGCIAGLKKATFNAQDFGVVVMSSQAISHSTP